MVVVDGRRMERIAHDDRRRGDGDQPSAQRAGVARHGVEDEDEQDRSERLDLIEVAASSGRLR
jgi:hypothetical protein